jgi:hypothetical protein
MGLIVVCSIAAITASILAWLQLREQVIMPNSVISQLRSIPNYAMKGDIRPLQDFLEKDGSMLSRLGGMAISGAFTSKQECHAACEIKAREEIHNLERGIPLLEVMVTVAPLLGLLGTTAGLVGMFSAFGTGGEGSPDTAAIAHEIGVACAAPSPVCLSPCRRCSRTPTSRAGWMRWPCGGIHHAGDDPAFLPALRGAASCRLIPSPASHEPAPPPPSGAPDPHRVAHRHHGHPADLLRRHHDVQEGQDAGEDHPAGVEVPRRLTSRARVPRGHQHHQGAEDLPRRQAVDLDKLAIAITSLKDAKPGMKLELQADTTAALGVLVKVWDALRDAGYSINDVPARIQKAGGS